MLATIVDYGGRFTIGRVFRRGLAVVGRNPLLFVGLSVIFAGLPMYAARLLLPSVNVLIAQGVRSWGPAFLLIGLAYYALRSFLIAALVWAAIEDLSNRRPGFGASLAAGINMVLPVFCIEIIVTFCAILGLALLIVPGIIVGLMWISAIPAQVAERRGVLASITRSRALTDGSRMSIFGFQLVFGIAIQLSSYVIGRIARLLGPMVVSIAISLTVALVSCLVAAMLAAVYVELRVIKEGGEFGALGEVFA